MDLARMLEKCRRGQWTPEEIDWSRPPAPLSADDERRVVQYFTDMAGIERLAAALFAEQRARAGDPTLRAVFDSFVGDELRHAEVAERLARHFDRHAYRDYATNPALQRFSPHFVRLVRWLSPEVANVYVTVGELILDLALLRSLDAYVGDPTSHAAMERINRDESRHIAVDLYMLEWYSSDAARAQRERRPGLRSLARALTQGPRAGARELAACAGALSRRAAAAWALANVLRHAAPFIRGVFFEPMDRLDPSGRRLVETWKRIQLVGTRRDVSRRPFVAFLLGLQAVHQHRLFGPIVGPLVERLLGLQPRLLATLYSEAERQRVAAQSMDEVTAELHAGLASA